MREAIVKTSLVLALGIAGLMLLFWAGNAWVAPESLMRLLAGFSMCS